MDPLRVLRGLGLVLVALGVVVLLFTAYQLWGTGLFEAHSQDQLRSSLEHQLPRAELRQSARDAKVPETADPGPPQVAPLSAAPPNGKAVGVIEIPSIGLDQVVVQGVSEADLRLGPGHYPGTPLPGELGNSAIAGHRTTYGHPFYNLNAVPVGAPVNLITRQGIFVYRTQWLHVVSPDDTSLLGPSRTAELTLTTCTPRFSAAQRLVLRGVLVRSRLSGAAPLPGPIPSGINPAELAGASGGSDWVPALLWGVIAAAVGTLTLMLGHRARRRWPLYLGGTVAVLVVLFFFFASMSALLPASF